MLTKVTDGVYVAVGYALANSILLEAPDGLIIVDTTESKYCGRAVMEEFRKIFPDQPVKAVIYTHSHEDHMAGTSVGEWIPFRQIYIFNFSHI